MKSRKELEELREEVAELTPEELKQVAGGLEWIPDEIKDPEGKRDRVRPH